MQKRRETRKAKEILRNFGIFLVILLVVSFLYGELFYNGFFFGVPSAVTYVEPYSNLASKAWDEFITNHTQLDPKNLQSMHGVWLTVSDVNWKESATRPHDYFSFDVSYGTNFEVYPQTYSTGTLQQPSLLIFILDQNDRIRGKLYSIQSSADFIMSGDNETDATFWFKIPSDMQNQQITIIAELFGVYTTNPNNNYNSYSGEYTHFPYIDSYDDVYGNIPASQSTYLPQGYVSPQFLATSNFATHTPSLVPSIWEMIGYASFFALVLTALSSVLVLVRNKSGEWWNRNKVYVIFGIAFLITYIIILVIVGIIM
jgi:hypothetical protein